jgi:hypothetical protein
LQLTAKYFEQTITRRICNMALVSPGVEVRVIDESFYTPAEPGTTPLIVVATAQNKPNAAGTGTAAATTPANAGVAFRLTSQKDLVDLFGVPFFEKTVTNTPVHGSERNEYGLLAAYSLLGVTNSVFMIRANVNLNELAGVTTAPGSEPEDNQWWVDTRNTAWGIQEWNSSQVSPTNRLGQKFAAKTPIVLTNSDSTKIVNNAPAEEVGANGDYAVVFETGSAIKESAKIYYKSSGGGNGASGFVQSGQWVLLGSPDWVASHPVISGTVRVETLTAATEFLITTVSSATVPVSTTTTITISSAATFADRYAQLITSINAIPGISANTFNGRIYFYSDGSVASIQITATAESIGSDSVSVLSLLGIVEGTYLAPVLTHAPHTRVPAFKRSDNPSTVQGVPTGSVWIKTTEPNAGARWRVNQYNSRTSAFEAVDAPLFAHGHEALFNLDRSGGGINLPADTLFVQYNSTEDYELPEAQYRVWRRAATGRTEIVSKVFPLTGGPLNGLETFTIFQSVPGVNYTGSVMGEGVSLSANTFDGTSDDAERFAALVRSAIFEDANGDPIPSYIGAEVTEQNEVRIFHRTGGEIRFWDGTGTPIANLFVPHGTTGATANFYQDPSDSDYYIASNWKPLAIENFIASGVTPLEEATNGQLWYNPAFTEVDIMVHNGTTWVGYRNEYPSTLATGPIVSASTPVGNLWADRQLWISTADTENFPTIYRWDDLALEWILIDKADQTSEDGVLFADARYGSSGASGDVKASIVDLLSSNYLDPDAPDPGLYPRGMLLWNLRRSGGNVKRYVTNYINRAQDNIRFNNESMAGGPGREPYAVDRWVTASANNEDGSGSFGRKAQRKVIVAAMKSVIDTNDQIRDEERRNFNIIAAPGYPEVLSNLINLNIDRGLTAFVIGDTPLRLRSDATTLVNWGTNARLVTDNGDDGIVSFDEYAAVYYPNGFTTDLGGNNAVVPASHMMLRTIALSDQVSFPWFAPAGTRRGGITNATAVGFIDAATGEFQTVALNEGTRDVLYDLKVNPIPFFVGVGHVAFGQKTRGRNASALDRINVARLVVYLRSQLNKLARPYIFEPNDKITRDEIKGAVESLLLELVGLRAIFDFAVVCDESNNTPTTIDRNELVVDIAIEPVKAIEFIYIPLRVKNTGEI